MSLKQYSLASVNRKGLHVWNNISLLPGDKRFVVGKAGYTDEAMETFAGVFKVRLAEGGERKIAVIVLHTKDREGDTKKILKYLEQSIVYGETVVQ